MPAKIEKIQMKNVGLSYYGSRCLRNIYSGCHDMTALQQESLNPCVI